MLFFLIQQCIKNTFKNKNPKYIRLAFNISVSSETSEQTDFILSGTAFQILQSWTKVLTHLSKTNAFYQRPFVISKSIFFVDSQRPLSPFSMLQYAPWTLSPGYNIEKGRGGRNVKIRHWKLAHWTKRVFFGECLNYFCPWLSELYLTHCEAFPVSSLFRLLRNI